LSLPRTLCGGFATRALNGPKLDSFDVPANMPLSVEPTLFFGSAVVSPGVAVAATPRRTIRPAAKTADTERDIAAPSLGCCGT
jgi:hypothetical protein